MREQRNIALIGVIYLLLFGLYNLFVFLVFSERTSVFWISYSFMTIAFVAQIASMLLSFYKSDMETTFMGIPLVSLSIYYLLAELFCSLVFMFFQGAGVKPALLLQCILLVLFAIIAIIAIMSRDAIQDLNDVVKENVSMMKSFHVDIEMLMHRNSDAELKASLKRLADTVKYSDPMTNAAVAGVEQRITLKLSETRDYYDSGMLEEAKKACSELELLFVERNKKLLISK